MPDLAEILQQDSLDKRELVKSMPMYEIVAELPLIFSSSNEAIACKGLDVLKLICETLNDPPQARLLVSTVLYAFENSSSDVHARALEMLKRFAYPLDQAFAEELRQRIDTIAAALRPTAEALLATAGGARSKSSGANEDDSADGGTTLDELAEQCKSIEQHWRRLAGLDEGFDAASGKVRTLKSLQFGPKDVVRLDPSSRFLPIKDPDELIDMLMRGFTMQLSEAEIERLLDGVSKVARPAGSDYWDARFAALRARAKNEGGFLGPVALAWAFGIEPDADQYFESLIHKRVNAVAKQLASGQKVALLATPTHAGLWIDARVLVHHAKKIANIDTSTTLVEQVQALLRLAPEHRAEALSDAQSLEGEFGSALRYALGSDKETFGDNVPLWVAAIRARLPLSEPYCMKVNLVARTYPLIDGCLNPTEFKTDSARLIGEYLDSKPGASHEMVALIGDMDIGNIKSPLCTEVFWARQFREASESREKNNNYWQEDGWEHLYDPDLAVGGMALHSLIYGLNAISSEARLVSVKILTRAIYDGRVDGGTLGAMIAHHYSDLLSTLWIEGLHEVARESVLHAQVVHEALETIVGLGPVPDSNPDVALLEELLQLCGRLAQGITCDTARNYLDAITGGGNAENLAKQLLAIECFENSEHSCKAGLIALKERIKRANRWQAWHNATLAAAVV